MMMPDLKSLILAGAAVTLPIAIFYGLPCLPELRTLPGTEYHCPPSRLRKNPLRSRLILSESA